MSNRNKNLPEEVVPETPEVETEEVAEVETENLPEEVVSGGDEPPVPTSWEGGERPEGEYNTLVNLKHNGVRYAVGDKINLEADEAAKLIADGSVF